MDFEKNVLYLSFFECKLWSLRKENIGKRLCIAYQTSNFRCCGREEKNLLIRIVCIDECYFFLTLLPLAHRFKCVASIKAIYKVNFYLYECYYVFWMIWIFICACISNYVFSFGTTLFICSKVFICLIERGL